MEINVIAGILGMALILVLFLLNNLKKISTDSITYDSANALGAFLLVYYGTTLRAWPFVVLNSVWGFFSLWEVISALLKRKK